jgi:anti-sigma factor ChrR (cupin superfamily)
MTGEHRHDEFLAAGAALGDLGPQEQARWAAQRRACPACRSLESELDGVLAELALAVPPLMPPPSVLDRIRTAIRAEEGRVQG